MTDALIQMAAAENLAAEGAQNLADAKKKSGGAGAGTSSYDSKTGTWSQGSGGSGEQVWVSQSDLARSEADSQNARGAAGPGNETVPGSTGLNPFSTAVLDAEGNTKGAHHVGAYDLKVANDFDTFARNSEKAFGKPSFISDGFKQLAQFVRDGRFSGNDASRYAQAIFYGFTSGAINEMVDPTASNAMKALDAEFIAFESSGQLQNIGSN